MDGVTGRGTVEIAAWQFPASKKHADELLYSCKQAAHNECLPKAADWQEYKPSSGCHSVCHMRQACIAASIDCSHCCLAHNGAAVFSTRQLLCLSSQVQLLLALLAGKPANKPSRPDPQTSARNSCQASKTNFAWLCQAHLG